jgi:hypothetical protein
MHHPPSKRGTAMARRIRGNKDWNVKFDREALVAEPLYHTPDADGLKITSTSTLTAGAVKFILRSIRPIRSINRIRVLNIFITKILIINQIMSTKRKGGNNTKKQLISLPS